MFFWWFMLGMDLIMPLLMIVFGKCFMKQPPKEINPFLGYRTEMSMKNEQTWKFAHSCCGRKWYFQGWCAIPLTVALMLLAIGKNADFVGVVGGTVCGLQILGLMAAVWQTEIALKKAFDKDGKKK